MRDTAATMKNIRGFTIAEVLGVVAIIAILAAILFPVFARAREKARDASCRANLANIAMALRTYALENDGRYPPGDNDLRPLLPVYLDSAHTLACPSSSNGKPFGALPTDEPPEDPMEPGMGPSTPSPGMEAPPPAPPGEPGGPPPEEAQAQEEPPPETPGYITAEEMLSDRRRYEGTAYFYISEHRYGRITVARPLCGDNRANRHNDRGNVLMTDGSIHPWSAEQYREAGLKKYAWLEVDEW
ncbi:MAG: type II secretion system protein [Armatimonadota bacterium]